MTIQNLYVTLPEADALVVDTLPDYDRIEPGSVFVIRNYESRYLTHKFHKFPGKFIPELPRWAMTNFLRSTGDSLVVDPFVGSGTTLVEASLQGVDAIGADIDPLARLIAKVKVTPIDSKRLDQACERILRLIANAKPTGHVPAIATLNHWFSDKAINDLSSILGVVDSFRDDRDLHDFLTVCFSAILRRASKADNQTMKTYVSHTHPKREEAAKDLFRSVLIDYSERLQKFSSKRDPASVATILECDARRIADEWETRGLPLADLGVTSPPYIKSVDYIYNQMAELFWIGERWGLETQPKQNEFKRRYMGTEKIDRTERPALDRLDEVSYWLDKISKADQKLGLVARKYFLDTVVHFRAMARILKNGAFYTYVVGDSTLAGIAVPTSHLVAVCARNCGFDLKLHFGYEIRNKHMRFPRGGRGGVVVHDWVMVLQRGDQKHESYKR